MGPGQAWGGDCGAGSACRAIHSFLILRRWRSILKSVAKIATKTTMIAHDTISSFVRSAAVFFGSECMNVLQAPTQEHHLYVHAGRRDLAATENAANAPLVRFIGEGAQFTFICRRCPGWPTETISQC